MRTPEFSLPRPTAVTQSSASSTSSRAVASKASASKKSSASRTKTRKPSKKARHVVRQPVAGRDLAADDELAQLVGDLLVGLAHALHATEPVAWCGHGSLSDSPNVSVNAISSTGRRRRRDGKPRSG